MLLTTICDKYTHCCGGAGKKGKHIVCSVHECAEQRAVMTCQPSVQSYILSSENREQYSQQIRMWEKTAESALIGMI